MAFKFVIISCLVAVASAGALPAVVEPVVAAPVGVVARLEEPVDTSSYTFVYDVFDSLTGDVKGQYESREGPVVKGRYFLNQDDGTRRIVEYYADDQTGFLARVVNEPLTAPVVAAEPVVAEPVAARVVAEPVAARVVAGTAPVAPAPAAVAPASVAVASFSPYTGGVAPLARFASFQYPQFARFAAPFRAPVVAV